MQSSKSKMQNYSVKSKIDLRITGLVFCFWVLILHF